MEAVQAAQVAINESWTRISANVLEFGVLMFRHMFDQDRTMLKQFSFGTDERDRAKITDLRGVTEDKEKNTWFVLFKDTIKFTEVTECLARLRIAPSMALEGAAPLEPDSFQLNIINNDTLEPVNDVELK